MSEQWHADDRTAGSGGPGDGPEYLDGGPAGPADAAPTDPRSGTDSVPGTGTGTGSAERAAPADPWAPVPPADDTSRPGGASGPDLTKRATPAGAGTPLEVPGAGSGGAHRDPWAPPTGDTPAHSQPTVASMPTPHGTGGAPNPFAVPGTGHPTPPAGFPPPVTVPMSSPVPPPPTGPEGPGQQYPHGYPGYPGAAMPQPPYPSGPGFGWGGMPQPPRDGMGVASLVLGIISVVIFCLWPVALITGALAVIFGAVARSRASKGLASNPGQALAGLICGAVGAALAAGLLVLLIVAPGNWPDNLYDDNGSPSLALSSLR
ncbi:DUF4190 domain-containing protein [Streptomyces uncialis]|uniref:DUF4190 domain-containing protein n=1 Tax=Streptomyces uncialis TaxID=1048205 RepID=UPI002250FED5|nr:DUF4190 domain-containing protein [Streptomyces uncialis]MCX4659808.1 DUF4190 domain-containing protein [Streptomyces uncialis]